MDFIRKHRQLVLWAGIVVLILAAIYVTGMLKTGIWYGDTFLYEQEEGFGTLDGSTQLQIQHTSEGARASFRSEAGSRDYRLSTKTRMTEIFEDGRLKFRGSVQKTPAGSFRFLNERGEPVDGSTQVTGGAEQDFPDAFLIYTWIMEDEHAIRGNPWVLIAAGLLAALIAAVWGLPRVVKIRIPARVRMTVQLGAGALLVLLLILGYHHF